MASVREKWKRGFAKAKLTRKDSQLSVISSMNSIMEEEDISETEQVDAYLSRLKQKTGLKSLWSGNKFTNYVDGDRTPDISTDSDEELDLKLSQNPDYLRQLTLDSDEDEMRIDFMRQTKGKTDKNNNLLSDDNSDDDSEPINLMHNIHFAELAVNDIDLSENDLKADKPDDFMPNVYTANFEKEDGKSSSSESGGVFGKNIHVLDDSEIVEEDENDQSLRVNQPKSDVSIDTESVHTEKTISEVEEEANSSETSKSSEYSRSKSSSKDLENRYSQSSFETDSSPLRKHLRSKTSSRRRRTRSKSSEGSSTHSQSEASTLVSTSSVSSSRSASKKEFKTSKSASSRPRKEKKRQSNSHRSRSAKKNAHTQTQCIDTDDYTEEMLKFRYNFNGSTRPNNPTRQTVDTAVMDALTSYNPAVLAANDMLKFHLDLLKQHIDNSHRLYEAYASESLKNNYKYTTYEDTLKFIEKNRPSVIKFEDALKEIQKVS